MHMAVSTKRKSKPELLARSGTVADWGGHVSIHGDRRAGEGCRTTLMSLDIRGEFTTPVKGVAAFRLRVTPEISPSSGNAEIPAVGVWTSAKPALEGSVYLSDREFDLVRTMAAAGKLASIYVSFQQPHYGSSLIASVSFSSDPPEAE